MSFPKYEAYKDSGVEWLGEVPEHWKVFPLRRAIAQIESGTSVNAADIPVEEGRYGVLKTSCVYKGWFDWRENKTVVDDELARVSCPLQKNTLIVSRMNTPELVGAAGLVLEAPNGIFLPDRLWQVSFNQQQLPHFIYYFTRSELYRSQVKLVCYGASSSMQNLSQNDFRSVIFAVPPEKEQTQIARFLDHETARIDALITEQQRLIELLKEKRQAVISHAVTKGLDPTAPMKDSGVEWLGEVPEHWEVLSLKRVVVFQRGHDLPTDTRQPGDIPVVSSGGYSGTHNVACAKAPGIVTGRYGSIGEFILVEQDYWPLNTALYSIQLHDNLPRYVWYLLQSHYEHFVLNSLKSAVPGVDRNDIHTVNIVLAPKEDQSKIVLYLDNICERLDQLTTEANKNIELLQERRSALISAAVTGKIDVRGWQAPVSPVPTLEAAYG